jgi:NADH-quinone oxidoreductase subunit A
LLLAFRFSGLTFPVLLAFRFALLTFHSFAYLAFRSFLWGPEKQAIFNRQLMLFLEVESAPVSSPAASYFPIIIQFIVAAGFVGLVMVVTHTIGPSLRTKKKLQPFESGIKSVGNARQPFAIKYFLTAILFVLFDVEVIFLYPWAVNFYELGTSGLITMGLFMGLLLAGFFYIIKSGALDWE